MKKTTKTTTVQQQTRRQRPKRSRNRKAKKEVLRSNIKLSDCALEYAACVTAPSIYKGPLPCIPDFTMFPSHKFKTKVRFQIQTGVRGNGFALAFPVMAALSSNGTAGANTDCPCIGTTAAYDNNNIVYAIAGGAITTPGVFPINSNSPYSAATSTTRAFRLVASGLMIQYMGTDFKNQGTVYLTRRPVQSNIPSGTTAADLMMYDYNTRIPVSRKPQYVNYVPSDQDYCDYHFSDYTGYSPIVSGQQRFSLGIYIEGGDTSAPQSWAVELTSFYEMTGPGLSLTPSHSDPVGYGAVVASLPANAPTVGLHALTNQVVNKAIDHISSSTSQIVTNRIVPAMANVAAAGLTHVASATLNRIADLL